MSRDLDTVLNDGTLVAAGGNSTSADWIQLGERYEYLIATKKSTGGTYAFEIDWALSSAGPAVFTQVVTLTDNMPLKLEIAAPYAKFRVKNTGGAAFTVHATHVGARSS